MERCPPPLDDKTIEHLNEEPSTVTTLVQEEEEPLFADASQSLEDFSPLQPDATVTVLEDPVLELLKEPEECISSPPPRLDPTPVPVVMDSPSLVEAASSRPLDIFGDRNESEQQEEDEDNEVGEDTFDLMITVTDPAKKGDGMGAYISYTVVTKTSMPYFKNSDNSVKRRFSDFLGLGHRLSEKHMLNGCIVPPAPEKSVVGMTKVKLSKTEDASFLERRRAALERYLNRIGRHPVLRKDRDFLDFLENPDDLPKASDTAALSGAGFMRLVKNVGESISKIAGKKAETDCWFDEKEQNFEVLDTHLRKLHAAIETMTGCRKDLCISTDMFAKSVATLGNVEENDSISHALARLSEVEEKVENLQNQQFSSDLYVFGETVKDYVALLASIKLTFQHRVKVYNTWLNAQTTLVKKKENVVKLQAAGKVEKLALANAEIEEWDKRVEEGQKNFDNLSKTLKKDVKRFEIERAEEFKEKFVMYLESLMKLQQEFIKLWEEYLPDAQAIS